MPKIASLALVAFLTVVAASFWLKPSVSQSAAGARDHSTTISVHDMHRNADTKSMPATKMNDRSFVFTDND